VLQEGASSALRLVAVGSVRRRRVDARIQGKLRARKTSRSCAVGTTSFVPRTCSPPESNLYPLREAMRRLVSSCSTACGSQGGERGEHAQLLGRPSQIALELRRPAPLRSDLSQGTSLRSQVRGGLESTHPDDGCTPARPPRHDKVDPPVVVLRPRRAVRDVLEHDERLVERVERPCALVLTRRAQRRRLGEGEDAVGRDKTCARGERGQRQLGEGRFERPCRCTRCESRTFDLEAVAESAQESSLLAVLVRAARARTPCQPASSARGCASGRELRTT